jgi:hypothetical protein
VRSLKARRHLPALARAQVSRLALQLQRRAVCRHRRRRCTSPGAGGAARSPAAPSSVAADSTSRRKPHAGRRCAAASRPPGPRPVSDRAPPVPDLRPRSRLFHGGAPKPAQAEAHRQLLTSANSNRRDPGGVFRWPRARPARQHRPRPAAKRCREQSRVHPSRPQLRLLQLQRMARHETGHDHRTGPEPATGAGFVRIQGVVHHAMLNGHRHRAVDWLGSC